MQGGLCYQRRWGALKDGAGETMSVPFKTKKEKIYPGKEHRKVGSPEVGGNLVQLRNREKTKRSMEYRERQTGSGRTQRRRLCF